MLKKWMIIVLILMACGGASHPTLSTARSEANAKRFDNAYKALEPEMYSNAKKDSSLQSLPEAWVEMAKLHDYKKDYYRMVKAFQKALEIDSKRAKQTVTDDINKVYRKNVVNNAFVEAINLFKAANELSGEEKINELKKAEEIMLALNIFQPDSADFISVTGKIYDVMDSENALIYYKKATELAPSEINFALDLGYYYFNKKDYGNAIIAFDNALKISNKNENALKFKAYSFQNDSKFSDAIKSYEEYLALKPDDAEVSKYLSTLYYQEKMYQQAINLSKKHIDANANCELIFYTISINSHFNIFNDLNGKKKDKEANAMMKNALSIIQKALESEKHTENADIWNYAAISYATLGMKKEAKDAEKKYKSLSKN